MFNIFKKKKQEETFDDIWEIEDKNSFLIKLDDHLGSKSKYGDKMDNLSHHEQVIYMIMCLEREVNNGGFSQFYFNSSGQYANDISSTLKEVGANKMAAICDKALACFSGSLPLDRKERMEFVIDNESDEVTEKLGEYDSEFWSYPDNLTELCYTYVFNNRSSFTE